MLSLINQDAETKQTKQGEHQKTGLSKQYAVKRANAIKTERKTWVATWRDLRDYIYPTLGFFDTPSPNQGTEIDHTLLIDEEGTHAADAFAAGMTSGFTSPSRPWFEYYLDDDELMNNAEVKYWLDDARNKMLEIYQNSNTYPVLTALFKELSVFGTACAYVEEDYDNVIRLEKYTIGEFYLGRDRSGRVNAFYRRFWKTTEQMVEEFGIENCSQKVQDQYRNNMPDTWNIVNFLVEENNDRVPFLRDYKNMPYRALYWEDGTEEDSFLKIGGYEEFPFIAPVWDRRTSSDTYGNGSPGWKSLGAVKELQKKKKTELIGLEKNVNPPLQKDSSVVGEVNTLPGGITTYSSMHPNAGVKPTYQVNLDLASLNASIQDTKQNIRRFFYTDLFMMMLQAERSGTPVTATEIMEKQSEKLSMLGPVLERWQGDDFIKSFIERSFNIAFRTGVFLEPPEALQDVEIKIRYTSILAQAQKMQGIAAIDQWVESVLAVAQANPNIIDNINFDELAKEKADMLGIPAKILNSDEAIARMRQVREQMAQQQQKAEQAQAMAEIAQKGASAVKSMGDTEMDSNSALDSTLEAVKGAVPK